jgi:hypothetical protein
MLILLEFTTSFYTMIAQLFNWLTTQPINVIGITFTPFELLFNWGTLAVILIAVISKKLVPFL